MNLVDFFNEHEIKIWSSGKNVSKNHINIQCMFCDDESNHLGINLLDFNKCNCWKCGKKNFVQIVSAIRECSLKEAKNYIKENFESYKILSTEEKNLRIKRRVTLPKEATDNFPKKYLDYLKNRGFNPKEIIKKYKLKCCGIDGPFKFRIIIPIYQNKKLVSFTSRDITGKQLIRYKNSTRSLIDKKKIIFGLDEVKEGGDAFLVEGPFDVMKMGYGAFCFMGITQTPERIFEVAKKNINNLYILLDKGEREKNTAQKFARMLGPIVKKTHILNLESKKDPGELTMDEVNLIRKALNFKN